MSMSRADRPCHVNAHQNVGRFLGTVSKHGFVCQTVWVSIRMKCTRRMCGWKVIVNAGRRRPRSLCHLPAAVAARPVPDRPPRTYPIGGMFHLDVDDDIA